MYENLKQPASDAVHELLEVAKLQKGDIFVVGCSSSEVGGYKIGSGSSPETATAIFEAIYPIIKERGIYLAAQCCEHLNRAIIIEAEAARQYRIPIVNVVPQPKAGGSFATAAYQHFAHPVAIESLHQSAKAGIDIGGTLIGMHIAPVVVPVRIGVKKIGEANIICARSRPKFIGGERAHYDENML